MCEKGEWQDLGRFLAQALLLPQVCSDVVDVGWRDCLYQRAISQGWRWAKAYLNDFSMTQVQCNVKIMVGMKI